MRLKTQRRVAARILKTGKTRIWIDPDAVNEVSGAMTHGDVRKFIGLGFIKAKPVVGNSRNRWRKISAQKAKGRRKGHGKRKGASNARAPAKKQWMQRIRALRALLKGLRGSGKITMHDYRSAYLLSKAGTFKNKAHLMTYLNETKKIMKTQKGKNKAHGAKQ